MASVPTVVTAALGAGVFILFRRKGPSIRIVKLDNLWQRVLWSLRVSWYTPDFPRNLQEWNIFVEDDPSRQFKPGWNAWMFLRPFFASRGYTLYDKLGELWMTEPHSTPAPAPSHIQAYPYAKHIPDGSRPGLIMNSDYQFFMKNASVWAARDTFGRDVVIKIISDLDNPSSEWLALQRLNSPELRRHPGNRTIHVIEFLTFDNFVFAVMPRWDCAFESPFTTVSELMNVAKSYLEALYFLHQHRIAHLDIKMHNCGINAYSSNAIRYTATSIRNPNEVQYVVYDFGYSMVYPVDTDLSTISLERFLYFLHAPSPTSTYNPFKADVSMMGGLLFGFVMHAATTIPEIEPFLYRMMHLDEDTRPSASAAFQEFLQIYSTLTPTQLGTPVHSVWTNQFRTNLLPRF